MPVESAADRAALFDADEFAEHAQYRAPDGAVLPCTIIWDRDRDERDPFEVGTGSASGARAVIARQMARILADQVPVVVAGAQLVPGSQVAGVFVPGPVTLKVSGRPRLDETGAVWTVDLTKL